MNKSVHEQVPDGLSLADEGLVRWVTEVRRSVGPSCREAGAQRLRASAQARGALPGAQGHLHRSAPAPGARRLADRPLRPCLHPADRRLGHPAGLRAHVAVPRPDARCTARSYRALAVLHPLWWRLCEATPAIALTPQPAGRHDERPWPRDVDYCLQRRVIEIRDGVLALRPYPGLSDPDRAEDALVLLGVSERDRALVAEAAWLEVARRAKLAGVQPTSDQVRTAAGAVDLAGEIRSLTRIAKNLPVVDAAADLLDDSRKIRV